jgi:hypothetical protein
MKLLGGEQEEIYQLVVAESPVDFRRSGEPSRTNLFQSHGFSCTPLR